jgi:hypothetical protein
MHVLGWFFVSLFATVPLVTHGLVLPGPRALLRRRDDVLGFDSPLNASDLNLPSLEPVNVTFHILPDPATVSTPTLFFLINNDLPILGGRLIFETETLEEPVDFTVPFNVSGSYSLTLFNTDLFPVDFGTFFVNTPGNLSLIDTVDFDVDLSVPEDSGTATSSAVATPTPTATTLTLELPAATVTVPPSVCAPTASSEVTVVVDVSSAEVIIKAQSLWNGLVVAIGVTLNSTV